MDDASAQITSTNVMPVSLQRWAGGSKIGVAGYAAGVLSLTPQGTSLLVIAMVMLTVAGSALVGFIGARRRSHGRTAPAPGIDQRLTVVGSVWRGVLPEDAARREAALVLADEWAHNGPLIVSVVGLAVMSHVPPLIRNDMEGVELFFLASAAVMATVLTFLVAARLRGRSLLAKTR